MKIVREKMSIQFAQSSLFHFLLWHVHGDAREYDISKLMLAQRILYDVSLVRVIFSVASHIYLYLHFIYAARSYIHFVCANG